MDGSVSSASEGGAAGQLTSRPTHTHTHTHPRRPGGPGGGLLGSDAGGRRGFLPGRQLVLLLAGASSSHGGQLVDGAHPVDGGVELLQLLPDVVELLRIRREVAGVRLTSLTAPLFTWKRRRRHTVTFTLCSGEKGAGVAPPTSHLPGGTACWAECWSSRTETSARPRPLSSWPPSLGHIDTPRSSGVWRGAAPPPWLAPPPRLSHRDKPLTHTAAQKIPEPGLTLDP